MDNQSFQSPMSYTMSKILTSNHARANTCRSPDHQFFIQQSIVKAKVLLEGPHIEGFLIVHISWYPHWWEMSRTDAHICMWLFRTHIRWEYQKYSGDIRKFLTWAFWIVQSKLAIGCCTKKKWCTNIQDSVGHPLKHFTSLPRDAQ